MNSRFVFHNLLWLAALLLVTALGTIPASAAAAPARRAEVLRAHGASPAHAFRRHLKASVTEPAPLRSALPCRFENLGRNGLRARHPACAPAALPFVPPAHDVRPSPGGCSPAHALHSERLYPEAVGANGERAPPSVS